MHTRRGLGWLFSPRSDESPKQSGVIESLEVDNFQLRQQLEEQRTSLLSCQEALDRAYRNMKELEQRLANLNQAHSEYIDKRDREFRNEIMRLRDQMSDVAAAGYSKQAIADSHKVSDNAILEIWKRMAYNIRVIATTLLTHCPPREELAVSYEGRPATVSNMAPAEYGLLADENLRAAVVENYIWRSVYARIFGGQRGKQSAKLTYMTASEFFHWKSQGAAMLENLVGLQDHTLRSLARTEHHGFSALLPPAKKADNATRDILYEELLSVYKDAVELHSIFMKSKAHFYINWIDRKQPSGGNIHYASECMEAEAWGETLGKDSVVVFSISPGLWKFGTANGADYNLAMLLVKPRVICE
ncbi:hypothetical protein LY78DRAFT_590426 [Colletotrichum sublineola]|nr:hypothetical protein LY78DRAFT_590426 [Colletotrichum sublineola]